MARVRASDQDEPLGWAVVGIVAVLAAMDAGRVARPTEAVHVDQPDVGLAARAGRIDHEPVQVLGDPAAVLHPQQREGVGRQPHAELALGVRDRIMRERRVHAVGLAGHVALLPEALDHLRRRAPSRGSIPSRGHAERPFRASSRPCAPMW